jgi:hypothetical protein
MKPSDDVACDWTLWDIVRRVQLLQLSKADHVAPAAAGEPLAAAVTDLMAACGIPAHLCGVTAEFNERSAVELLRYAAKLARKAAPSAEREGLAALALKIVKGLTSLAAMLYLERHNDEEIRLPDSYRGALQDITENAKQLSAALLARPGEGKP